MAARKVSSTRSYFVALSNTDNGEMLLVETPTSQASRGASSPGQIRVNRAVVPFEVKPEEEVSVETDTQTDEKTRAVSVVQTLTFSGSAAKIDSAAVLVQAGRSGANGKEVAEMARAKLAEPKGIEVGSTWAIVDPEDMPNLARRTMLVTAVAADYVTVEITNEFGEAVDAGRAIPTDWFSTRLVEVVK